MAVITKERSKIDDKITLQVYKNMRNKWSVRRTGAKKAIKLFDTREEAVRFARSLLSRGTSRIIMHKKDGTVKKVIKRKVAN